MKYSPILARTIAGAVLSGATNLAKAGLDYGIDPKEVSLWVAQCKMYGECIFSIKQDFDVSIRKLIVEDKLLNCLSIKETCLKYKILHRYTLRDWIRSYKTGSSKMMTRRKTKKGQPSDVDAAAERIRQLEEELYLAKAENAFLKKLQALMQETKNQRHD